MFFGEALPVLVVETSLLGHCHHSSFRSQDVHFLEPSPLEVTGAFLCASRRQKLRWVNRAGNGASSSALRSVAGLSVFSWTSGNFAAHIEAAEHTAPLWSHLGMVHGRHCGRTDCPRPGCTAGQRLHYTVLASPDANNCQFFLLFLPRGWIATANQMPQFALMPSYIDCDLLSAGFSFVPLWLRRHFHSK